jgi:DNA-binding transcriptional LysR family regulator
VEIHQLEYVLAVAKYQNFSLAAEEIAVSQANLSQQIKKLEKELGVELFRRSTRSVQLTSAGEEFVRHAERILEDIQQIKNLMGKHTNLNRGKIRIGAIKTIAYLGIASIISRFQQTYPGIQLELYEAHSFDLIKKLQASEIDVAFINAQSEQFPDVEFHPLIRDELVVVTPSGHRLGKKKVVEVSELANEKFLVLKNSTIHRSLVDMCRQAGFEPNIILAGSQIETIRGLVEEGIGISLFSSRVAFSLNSTKIAPLFLKNPIRIQTGLAVARKRHPLATKAFKEFVLQSEMKFLWFNKSK